jgi:hypothetical protein
MFPSFCLAILYTENPEVMIFAFDKHFDLADRADRDGAQENSWQEAEGIKHHRPRHQW